MTSTTTLYTTQPGNANVASQNFTTLYSGSGAINVQEIGQYGNANVVGLLATSTDGGNTIGVISATGNIVTSAYFIGDGSQLSNVQGSYANANVSAYLASGTNTANIITTGNVAGNYILGDGSQLTNVEGLYGNANVSAYLASGTDTQNIITTGNIIGGNLKTSGATGNIVGANYVSANFYLGDGGLLSNITSSYGNANVTALLGNFGSNAIVTTGNITADYFVGNVVGNITGNVVVPGANTDILINNNGNIGYGVGFTFNTVSNAMSVPGSISASGNVQAGNLRTGGSVSATGNIRGAYIEGNGSLLTSITGAYVTGTVANATYAATAGSAGSATTAVTVTGNAQANITSVGTLTSLSVTGNVDAGNVRTTGVVSATGGLTTADGITASGNISTTGNVIGAYLWGDGSNITGVVAAAETVQFDVKNTSGGPLTRGTPIYATGTVGATTVLEVAASRADTAATMPAIGILEQDLAVNATGLAISIGTLNSVNTIAYAVGDELYVGTTGGFTNVRPTDSYTVQKIASVGRVNSSTGSIQVNIWNIEDLPNLGTGNIWFGNASNVATQTTLSTFTGDIGAGNISVSGNVRSGNVSATGNVNTTNLILPNGGKILGDFTSAPSAGRTLVQTANVNGSTSLSIAPNGTGVVGGFAVHNGSDLGNASFGAMAALASNYVAIRSDRFGTGSYLPISFQTGGVYNRLYIDTNGNVGVGNGAPVHNFSVNGNAFVLGNVTGSYFVGNGSALTGIAQGSNTQIQFNAAGNLAGNAAMTFESVTGNIGLGNLVIGSGNTASVGAGQRINTIANNTGVLTTATNYADSQIVIGNGLYGNLNLNNLGYAATRGGKLNIWDSANISDGSNVGIRLSGISSNYQVTLAGNLSNPNSSMISFGGAMQIGGGTSGNTFTNTTNPLAILGQSGLVFVGQPSAAIPLGNTTLSVAGAMGGRVLTYAGSTTTTGIGINTGVSGPGNVTNAIGSAVVFQSGYGAGFVTPSKVYGYYMGASTTLGSGINGLTNTDPSRAATDYYFLRNDDPVAQNQIGTLRSYNEYNAVSGTTSGALTIDKAVSQVHQVNLAGNITSVTYANMVSSLSDSVNTDEEVDTVTIVFNQGATGGYSVAFPAGATYKYAGGVNTISTAANSVTLVAVTVVRISGTPTYLTTISPGFV